ncbi:alpha/beta hydrolase family protein [Chryseobacterium indoltheticum]|uniref:alpha/beta hydrolase family protein n=1 Tax=Chryseobacterium indoltheticum TaxID=254 RepID=UPI003F4931DA
MTKVGLMGRSFGGYETNFIATQSNRFAAYISGTGFSDPTHSAFAFNYGTYGPDYARIESGQYHLGDFVANKEKYIKNSPLFYMEQVKAPMLLWAGLKDKNVSPEGNKSTFSALRKYRNRSSHCCTLMKITVL